MATSVLAVHRLLRDAERRTDLLPRPPLVAGVADVQRLQRLEEPSQRGHCPEADLWVGVAHLFGQSGRRAHLVNVR
jgi:hypothetical protein